MLAYGEQAAGRGLRVISPAPAARRTCRACSRRVTPLPVIGVPVPLEHLDGMDSLLSIVQMPAGVPVATVSVGGARNAGLLAVRILAARRPRPAGADGRVPGASSARRRRPRARRCAGTAPASGVGFGA